VPGVAQLAPDGDGSGVLTRRDVGPPLTEVATPLAAGALVPFARDLARAVAGMHARGVVHRQLSPAVISVSDRGVPHLTDFSTATPAAESRPEFSHENAAGGDPPYQAPEQTGRTAWPVDQRADLYALGAILYQVATGDPPF